MNNLEELRKRIEDNKRKQQLVVDDSFISYYLTHYNINSGLDKLPTHVLYYAYLELLKKNEEELPLGSSQFYRELTSILKRKRWGRQRYYLVDRKLLKNIDENLEFRANLWKKTQVKRKTKTT